MSEYRLTHAVTDHRGDLLLEAGTVLSREAMQSVAGGATASIGTCRLMDFNRVESDLNDFFGEPPYDVIFKGTDRMRALLDIAGEVTMPRIPATSLGVRRCGEAWGQDGVSWSSHAWAARRHALSWPRCICTWPST